uniref:Retrotransposable element Tf2 n=1 Tax=Cajanus cajan TaxID=3821 RepID=A0A151TGZ1_CAJCA|nr:Retrotransposable element Tf2 [Cajanus cajan]
MISTDGIAELFQLHLISLTEVPIRSQTVSEVEELLDRYPQIFNEPRLTGFYRKFVKHYASIAAPLTNLLKKDSFSWSPETQQSFDQLKVAMTQAPVLSLPNFQEDFVLETDASGQGMGAVLLQNGASNRVADALTRVHGGPAQLMGLTISQCDLVENIQDTYNSEPEIQQTYQGVLRCPKDHPGFKIVKGVLLYNEKIYLSEQSPLKHILLEEFHATPIAGHAGIHRTYGRLSDNFFWRGMKKDVTEFVKACAVCQQVKSPTHLPYGLLQPLAPPTAIWEDISLDFVTGLPSFQTYTVIFVVVDRFSKAAHFGMLPTSFTAVKVAELFAIMVCKLHGMPKSIVSDRDPIFMSHFWQELFRMSGTKLRMSSAYHPQSDGQTEAVNKMLEQYLRAFVHTEPRLWGKYLHWAEWHYNSAKHTTTGITPYEVVYGQPPPSLPQYLIGTSRNEAMNSDLTAREELLAKLRSKLLKAQSTMKHYADQKRLPHPFRVGDYVLVKLRPYRQVTTKNNRTSKLAQRFYGPFRVVKQIGDVAFQLDLPDGAQIHPVFHVSKLKLFKNSDVTPALELPPVTCHNQPKLQPLAMLDWRESPRSGAREALIQWQGLFPEDATWEDLEMLLEEYPTLHLEDKVFVEGKGDVMTHGNEAKNCTKAEDCGSDFTSSPMLGNRPKRMKVRPKYFEDYDCNVQGSLK